ncbi:hypothetical protein BC940DRAFT_307250 [Gongronella butleri]|nr:hypothetical protein BC940DRAFT_307250 [Gongronella butleri]
MAFARGTMHLTSLSLLVSRKDCRGSCLPATTLILRSRSLLFVTCGNPSYLPWSAPHLPAVAKIGWSRASGG